MSLALREERAGVPERMRALILDGPERFHLGEVPVPRPGPYEVLCRVHAVAICGTDVHIIEGRHPGQWPREYPFIAGHEWSGEVVEAGQMAAAFGWRPGQRVAGTSHAGCGFCRMCREGRYNLCENYGRPELGHRQYGHYSQGAYAEYVVHSIKSVFPLPEALSLDEGALADASSIALWSAERGGVGPGDRVAVVGAGPMGILVAQSARVMGAAQVLVTGSGDRLERSRLFADQVVDHRRLDPVAEVRRLSDGGVDVAIDCAGTADSIRQAVEMTRKGGRVVFTGVPHEAAALPMQKIVLEELDLRGVRANRNTMERVLPLMAARRIDVAGLITHRFPLEEFARAYETFRDRVDGALKVLVHP